MTTVYWNYMGNGNDKWFSLTKIEPVPALPEIIKNRDTSHNSHFTRCPAFKEYYQNTYVIKSPIDMEVMYDKATNTLNIAPQSQLFYDANIIHRGDVVGKDDDFLMSFSLRYLFVADKDCNIELIPASMHSSDFTEKTRLITGAFNINRWYRPVEIAFEIKAPYTSVKFKRGEALAYVRFVPKDGGKVKLQEKEFSDETLKIVWTCLYVNHSNNKFSLKKLYELATQLRNNLWFNKKKCPFNWRNK